MQSVIRSEQFIERRLRSYLNYHQCVELTCIDPRLRIGKQKKRNNAGIVVRRPFEWWARSGRARYFRGFARDDTSIGVAILGVRIMIRDAVTKRKVEDSSRKLNFPLVRRTRANCWLQFDQIEIFMKHLGTIIVKGKGLFDAWKMVSRMRVLAGGGHLAFQSTAASGRQCTIARRLRNSLSRTGAGYLLYPDVLGSRRCVHRLS